MKTSNYKLSNPKYYYSLPLSIYDKIIFIGDYVDSFTKNNEEIINNLEDIILLKQFYPDKIELLLGNHDISYLIPTQRCSGFNPTMQPYMDIFFKEHINMFNLCYQIENVIWTHAGITNSWLEEFEKNAKKKWYYPYHIENKSISEKLNFAWKAIHKKLFLSSGPLWVRPNELNNDQLTDYIQIVGHTPFDKVTTISNVTYTDCLKDNSYLFDSKGYEYEIPFPNSQTITPTTLII